MKLVKRGFLKSNVPLFSLNVVLEKNLLDVLNPFKVFGSLKNCKFQKKGVHM